jgi:hypothetical protein
MTPKGNCFATTANNEVHIGRETFCPKKAMNSIRCFEKAMERIPEAEAAFTRAGLT